MKAIITDEIKINEIKYFEKNTKIIQYDQIKDHIEELKVEINVKKKI